MSAQPARDGGPEPAQTVDPVEQAIADYRREVESVLDRFDAAIVAEIVRPFHEIVRSAAEQHRRLMQKAAFDRPAGQGDGERARLWHEVRTYRGSVRKEILEPILGGLARIDAGSRIIRLGESLSTSWTNLVDAAPSEIRHVEPAALYEPRPDDSAARRLRKGSVRAGRYLATTARRIVTTVRRWFGVRTPRPRRRMQVVPFARLAGWHTTVRLQPLRSRCIDGLLAEDATATSGLEEAVSRWVHRFLGIGRDLDQPLFHTQPSSDESDETLRLHPEGVVEDSLYESIRTGCTEFQDRLDSLAIEAEPAHLRELRTGIDAAHRALARDCEHIGTFMLDITQRETPLAASRAEKEEQRRAALWPASIERIRGRIELGIRLETFRQDSQSLHDRFVADIQRFCDDRLKKLIGEARDTLAGIRDRVEPAFERGRREPDAAALAAAIRAIAADSAAGLERKFATPFRQLQEERLVETAAERCIDGLFACVAALPAVIAVQQPPAAGEAVHPDARIIRVRLRQYAEQAWDAVLLEQIRTSVVPFQTLMERIAAEIEQIRTVIRFNTDASIDELGEEVTTARLDGARELALNGFDRSIASLESLITDADAGLRPFAEATFEVQCRGWDRLNERIGVEDRMQEQLLDLGYRTRLAIRNALSTGTAILNRTLRGAIRQFVRIRGRVRELVRIGQSAVEGERATRADMQRTIDALSNIDTLLAGLPLVYRRLFSFQPVVDPAMLEGRRADLDEISRHYQHWRDGVTDALVITSSDGNGLTSFINVACRSLFGDANVLRLPLDTRLTDEDAAVARLAETLGMPQPEEPTFDALSRAILQRGRAQRPTVCVIETLEHMFLRTASGNGLLPAFASFMSHTDSCILWIATAGNAVWNFFERVEPTTAHLARRHTLEAFGPETIESIIINRHMRSGLPLRFVPPRVPPTLLRRRLSRAATEADRQAVLRADYFERLVRAAGGNIMLNLFYWLRSARIDEGSESLLAQPVEPLSFGYLESLTLQQTFSLKAFLDHASLTLHDHDRIFQMDQEASRQVFESLGNLLLIEPTDQQRRLASFSFSTVEDERRYRIRPLVVHPVLVYLRSRNMID